MTTVRLHRTQLPFLRSILGLQLSMADLAEISPHLAKTLWRLQALAKQRQAILQSGGKPAEIELAIAALALDGCAVVDLGLDFTLPGQPEVELVPNGAHISVTIDNVSQYVQRVLEVSLLEGVRGQINAFCKVSDLTRALACRTGQPGLMVGTSLCPGLF